jgi:hypothetical protein
VVAADRAEHLAVRRVARLPLSARRQLELLEEIAPELLRRPEDELLAGEVVCARLELLDAVGEAAVISPIRYVSMRTPASSIARGRR